MIGRPTFDWTQPWVIEAQHLRTRGLIRRTIAKALGKSEHQIRMATDLNYAVAMRRKIRKRNLEKNIQRRAREAGIA